MASLTDICNRALQKLGAARINAVTDQSTNARACVQCFEFVRDALLRAHPWNFAIQRFQLAASATAPAFGPANQFPLPTGWLRLLPPDPSSNYSSRDWTIENNMLMTNMSAPLNVRCVMKVTDTSQFDPIFVEALASRMAVEMAEQLTQSNSKKEACAQMYKDSINEAKKANAIEKVPQSSPDGSWITTRNSGFPSDGSWSGY